MPGLQYEADTVVNAVAAFHTHHSKMTWNAGTPGIEPWLRDTLVSLQSTLNQMSQLQLKMARQVDQNSERLSRVERHLRAQK